MKTADDIYEQWLVLRCQTGDVAALGLLANRYHRRLVSYAWRTTGNQADAEDIVQSAWVAVVAGLGRLEDPAALRPWIYRIVTNKTADWIRTRSRRRQQEQTLVGDPAAGAPVTSDDHELKLLRQTLCQLDEEKQNVVRLFYLDGLSITEIAAVLSLPVGTVKSRLHHARNQLRETIERKMTYERH